MSDAVAGGVAEASRTGCRWLNGVVLEDPKIGDGVRHSESVAPPDTQRRDEVHVLTRHFGNAQLRPPDPNVHDGEIVGERHRELVHRRLVLTAGRKLREVSAHGRRTIEDRRGIRYPLLELDSRGRQTFSVRGDACAEPASLRQRRRGRAGCGETAGLVNAAQLLRVALHPPTRERGVIVDENIGAVIDGRALEERLNEDEGFAVLIPGGVSQFIVGTGELPVEKPKESAPIGFLVRGQAGRKKRGDLVGMSPVFNGAVALKAD